MDSFEQGSPLHFLCLAVCVAALFVTGFLARYSAGKPRLSMALRRGIAFGCLLFWFLSNGYSFVDERFDWRESLPLHFCNLADLIGAFAIITRNRTSQALMYFWTFALCIWAFLTPSLYVGPTTLWFWLFWLYHLFIPIATAWIVVADGFRPTWADWRRALGLSLVYMAILAVLDAITGWNYGFVGPSVPSQKNLLDFLGAYPLRLVWMAFVGSGLFALLMLPWKRHWSQKSQDSGAP